MLKRKKPETLTSFKMDSKGHCFLCLERILPHFKLDEDSSALTTDGLPPLHSLADFARFLKMDMGKVFQDKGQLLPPRLQEKVKGSKLDVELCLGCASLAEEFSKRFRQLELVEMQVLAWVRLIYGKLVEAGESGKTEEFREFVGDSLIQGSKRNGLVRNLDVLEGLREAAIEKCTRKLSNSRPQVLAENLPPRKVVIAEKLQFNPIAVSKTYTRKNHTSYGKRKPSRNISLPEWGSPSEDAQATDELPVKLEVEISPNQILGAESAVKLTATELAEGLDGVKADPEKSQDTQESGSDHDGESMIWPFSRGADEAQSEDPLAPEEELGKHINRMKSPRTRPSKKIKRTKTSSNPGDKQKPRRRPKSGTKKYHEKYSDCPTNSNFRLKCPDCGLLFQVVKNFLLHRKESKSCGASHDPTTAVRVEILVPDGDGGGMVITGDDDKSIYTKILAIVDLPQEIFICEDCGLALYSSEDLAAHGKLHGTFECKFCDVQESYAPNLSIHELQHAPKKTEKDVPNGRSIASYHCARCGRVCCSRSMYLQHHLSDHLSLPLNEPKCPICKISASNVKESQLSQHFKTHHNLRADALPPEGVQKCKVANCKAYFTTAQYLSVHLKLRHNIKPAARKTMWKGSHKCEDCDMAFSYPHHLKRHRMALHLKPEQLIPCTVKNCASLFESEKELKWHMKRATAHHNFLRDGESVTAPCTICNKSFDARYLKIHMKSHRVMKDDSPSVCHVCGKMFTDKQKLYLHSRTHSNPENWKHRCHVCFKKFRTKVFLDGHMAIHTKESRFVCEICGRKYRQSCGLSLHKKLKHNADGGKYHELRLQKRRAIDAARKLRQKKKI